MYHVPLLWMAAKSCTTKGIGMFTINWCRISQPSTASWILSHSYPIKIPFISHDITSFFLVRSLYFDGLTEFNHHCYVGFHRSYRIFISTAARKTQAQRSPRSVCIGPFFWATCQDPTSHTWEPSTVKEWDKLLMDSAVFYIYIYIYIRVIYCNINNIYICVCACIHIYIYMCIYLCIPLYSSTMIYGHRRWYPNT